MGIEIEIGWLTLIMFGSLLALLMAGLPLAFVTGGLACVFLFILGDARALNIVPSRIFPLMTNYQLSAIPLFIFMAALLERSGIAKDMYSSLNVWLSRTRGGIAIVTSIMAVIMAAIAVSWSSAPAFCSWVAGGSPIPMGGSAVVTMSSGVKRASTMRPFRPPEWR